MDTTVVFAGGPLPSDAERGSLASRLAGTTVSRIVAADSGLHRADALDVRLVPGRDLVLGDMDSLAPHRLLEAEADGIAIERFPDDKDATDLELALDAAVAGAATGDRIVVVGTTVGRFDHVLATLWTLASDRYDRLVREAWLGGDVVHVVAGGDAPRKVATPSGGTFSVLAAHGDAVGVTVTGARWDLRGETLEAGTSRGVSNEAVDDDVVVACDRGTLLVVLPTPFDTEDLP